MRTPGNETESQVNLSNLEAYARKQIAATRYPHDYHTFKLARCPVCGLVPLSLTIEHHTGSTKGNFRGVIWGECSQCGGREKIFSFTGEHRKPEHSEEPVCCCGANLFVVGECERFEGDEGVMGFFDEGVVVAKCTGCDRNQVLVFTD